jgi:hypothetical protein
MPRKRVIYQSEALFVGPTGTALNPVQLNRIQSANYGFQVARQDVNQYGNLAAIDRIILEQPVVNLDYSYYLNSGDNEKNIGLTLSTSKGAFADILSGAANTDVKNYYILVSPEGTDANVDTGIAIGQGKVIGLGNAFLTSYEMSASVGEIPTATVNAEALNMRFYTGTQAFSTPAVNPVDGANLVANISLPAPVSGSGFSALRPGDISFTIDGSRGLEKTDLKVQSVSLSVDVARDPIQRLGSKFAFTKEITFPVTATMTVESILGDLEAGNLAEVVTNDNAKFDLSVTINKPGAAAQAMKFSLKGAKLDSQSFSSSIGDNKSVSLEFSSQIGGPNDTANGLFIEGAVS